MAWEDLPDELADADRSLSAVITVTLQGNLDQAYEQSCWGLGVLGDVTHWTRSIVTADVWEPLDTGFDTWPGMPVPLRPKRDGTWRGVVVRAQIKTTHACKVRAVLLERPAINASAVIADAEGFSGVTSYAEQDVSATGSFDDYVFEIVPDACEVRSGDGSVSGIALPVAWLHWIVQSTDAACEVTLRAPSPEETL